MHSPSGKPAAAAAFDDASGTLSRRDSEVSLMSKEPHEQADFSRVSFLHELPCPQASVPSFARVWEAHEQAEFLRVSFLHELSCRRASEPSSSHETTPSTASVQPPSGIVSVTPLELPPAQFLSERYRPLAPAAAPDWRAQLREELRLSDELARHKAAQAAERITPPPSVPAHAPLAPQHPHRVARLGGAIECHERASSPVQPHDSMEVDGAMDGSAAGSAPPTLARQPSPLERVMARILRHASYSTLPSTDLADMEDDAAGGAAAARIDGEGGMCKMIDAAVLKQIGSSTSRNDARMAGCRDDSADRSLIDAARPLLDEVFADSHWVELLDNTLMIQRVQATAPSVLSVDRLLLRRPERAPPGDAPGDVSGGMRKPKRKAAEGAAEPLSNKRAR